MIGETQKFSYLRKEVWSKTKTVCQDVPRNSGDKVVDDTISSLDLYKYERSDEICCQAQGAEKLSFF